MMAAIRMSVLLPVAAAVMTVLSYRALQPPPPKICGTSGGPPVLSPRIKLRDGRHLAYREWGVPREESRHRIVVAHGTVDTKDFHLRASAELVEKLGAYFVSFDRAGFAESDPNPSRTVKSEAMDIEELADRLGLGERFYVVGASMGGYTAWSCIKHIPHRLAGVALIVPVVNYWWPSLPPDLAQSAFRKLPAQDRRALWIARYAPWLFYAYMSQKLVATSSQMSGNPEVFSRQDVEILKMLEAETRSASVREKATQQSIHESFYRDIMVSAGDWGFEPTALPDPFPGNRGSVHLWQGGEDRIFDPRLQRYVARKLPWVRYHECAECGHLLAHLEVWSNAILRELLAGGTAAAAAMDSAA